MPVNPYEQHPDQPKLNKSRGSIKISMAQLDKIVGDQILKMESIPEKTWGYTKLDIEYWLRMVLDEAEKIDTMHDNKIS